MFVFVILNSVLPATLYITQSLVQLNSRWILPSIKGISSYRQKLIKHFSGTSIFASFNTPLSSAIGFPKLLE